jgi:hypothetical protein
MDYSPANNPTLLMTPSIQPAILIPLAIIADPLPMIADHQWELALLNYGVAGIVIVWFMWRDKLERQDRDRQHKENIDAQRRLESALRANTSANIVAVMAMKNVDHQYSLLMERVQAANENPES